MNDAPTATNLTQTKTYTEGAASVALDDIVVSEVDTSPAQTITATLTLALPAAGVLTTSGTATYTPGTGVWTISGSLAAVNAALAAVAFTPAADNDVDTTIATLIRDQDNVGPVAGVITLDVTPVNDAPTATNLTQTKTYTEGAASVALDDIVVSDVDTSPAQTITATLTLALPAAGVLTTSGTATYTPGTGVWTISGSLADVNAALAAVAFTPATDNDVDTTIATLIRDQDNVGPVAGVITLDVTPVNDAPTATNLTQTKTYTEGAASVALDDIVVSDVDTSPAQTITATLTLALPAAGVLTTSGTATYTPGTGVWTISGSLADVNAALAAVAFTPATDNDVDTTIATLIRDQDNVGPVAGVITLDVTPVNDAPTATNLTQTKTYTEGAASVALDDIVVSDVDTSPAQTITATLTLALPAAGVLTTSGTATYTPGTGVWTITGSLADVNAALAAVAFTPAADNDVDTTIATLIRDQDNVGPVAGVITLDVTPVNDAPTATNLTQTKTYTEGAASVALDDIVVSDVDTSPAQTITATLTLALPAAGVLTTSGTATYTPGTGVWTITGSLADVNAALAAVAFTPATDNDVDTTITTLIRDQDNVGPVAGVITLDVTPVGLFGAVLVPNPADPTKTDLIVGGTPRNDRISVFPATAGGVNVVINRQRFGPFDPTGRIVVHGQAGNDKISVDSPTCLSAFLYGQAGNDTLTGGCGDDVLVGGDGKDKLLDLLGRNLLLGGRGADQLSSRNIAATRLERQRDGRRLDGLRRPRRGPDRAAGRMEPPRFAGCHELRDPRESSPRPGRGQQRGVLPGSGHRPRRRRARPVVRDHRPELVPGPHRQDRGTVRPQHPEDLRHPHRPEAVGIAGRYLSQPAAQFGPSQPEA